jgi:threonine dehydrogenase-like Zn-dependent dehydrogenase
MKAWRIYGINDIRLNEVPMPKVNPGGVLLKPKMFQLSVTEIQRLWGQLAAIRGPKMPWSEDNPLQRLGHEFCAEVIELGDGVKGDLKVGDRVFWGKHAHCGKCSLCIAGYDYLCMNGPMVGDTIDGCLAEYFVVPEDCLLSVPDSISDSAVAALQTLHCVISLALSAEIQKGDTVAVFGQGVMGSYSAQVSRACGATTVIGVDIRDEVLTVSRNIGATDITINASNVNPIEAIGEITKGVGPDIVFDCASGRPEVGLSGTKTMEQALEVVRMAGKFVAVSILDADSVMPYAPLNRKMVQYRSSKATNPKEDNWMLDLVGSGKVQLEPLVTHVLEGLDKLPEAIEITGNKSKFKAINPAQVRIG